MWAEAKICLHVHGVDQRTFAALLSSRGTFNLRNTHISSGVFRISVRRARRRRRQGGGSWRWLGPLRGKLIFCPQNMFGCILMQFLTGRKHGQSLEALGHGFYCSIGKRSLQNMQKLSKNSWSDGTGVSRTIAPPSKYATSHFTILLDIQRHFCYVPCCIVTFW